MTQFVMIIMEEERASKNLSRGFPSSFILPSVMPSTVEKTTRPMMLVPDTCSLVMFQVRMSSAVTIGG